MHARIEKIFLYFFPDSVGAGQRKLNERTFNELAALKRLKTRFLHV